LSEHLCHLDLVISFDFVQPIICLVFRLVVLEKVPFGSREDWTLNKVDCHLKGLVTLCEIEVWMNEKL